MRTPLLLLLLATTVFAAARPKVIIDAPAPMKALLTRALKKKFTPVPPKSALPDEPGANAVKQAAREVGAVGLVTARLEAGVWAVMALNAADGSPLEQFKFKAPAGKKPLKALPKGTEKRLETALAKAKAPAKEEVKKDEPKEEPPKKDEPVKEEPVAENPKKKTKEPTKPPPPPKEEPVEKVEAPTSVADNDERPVALNIGVGVKLFGRRFFYKDDIFQALSKYTLPVGPALQLEADWYPAAHFTTGPATAIGLSVGFNYALGISSVANDGTRYGTSAMRLRLGLIGRFRLGPLELLPQAGYVLQTYSIANGAMGVSKPNIPDVRYSAIRAGLGTRTHIYGPASITAGAAYEIPLSTGEISSVNYFPRLKVGGLDVNFGLAVGPLFNRVELRLGVEYIRFWYSLNPEPGDKSVAGGALDDSFGGSLMLAFTL